MLNASPDIISRFAKVVGEKNAITDPERQKPFLVEFRALWTGHTPVVLRPGSTQLNPVKLYLAALGDSMTFFWDRYVLTFGLGDQISLFEDIATWSSERVASLRGRLARPCSRIRHNTVATCSAGALFRMMSSPTGSIDWQIRSASVARSTSGLM